VVAVLLFDLQFQIGFSLGYMHLERTLIII